MADIEQVAVAAKSIGLQSREIAEKVQNARGPMNPSKSGLRFGPFELNY